MYVYNEIGAFKLQLLYLYISYLRNIYIFLVFFTHIAYSNKWNFYVSAWFMHIKFYVNIS